MADYKRTYILLTLFLLLILVTLAVSLAYTVDERGYAYIDDANVRIEAPLTISGANPELRGTITPKTYSGNINVAWGFDKDVFLPTQGTITTTRTLERSLTCPFSGSVSNGVATCMMDDVVFFERSYDRIDALTNTIYWDDTIRDTIQASSVVRRTDFTYNGKDTWYFLRNVPISPSNPLEYTLTGEIPLGNTAKYDIAMYPSSYGTTISGVQQAINDGVFYYLDPFVNATSYAVGVNTNTSAWFDDDENTGLSTGYIGPSDGRSYVLDGRNQSHVWVDDQNGTAIDPRFLEVNINGGDFNRTGSELWTYGKGWGDALLVQDESYDATNQMRAVFRVYLDGTTADPQGMVGWQIDSDNGGSFTNSDYSVYYYTSSGNVHLRPFSNGGAAASATVIGSTANWENIWIDLAIETKTPNGFLVEYKAINDTSWTTLYNGGTHAAASNVRPAIYLNSDGIFHDYLNVSCVGTCAYDRATETYNITTIPMSFNATSVDITWTYNQTVGATSPTLYYTCAADVSPIVYTSTTVNVSGGGCSGDSWNYYIVGGGVNTPVILEQLDATFSAAINTPPVVANLTITPSVIEPPKDDKNASVDYYDADGDNGTVRFSWYINGVFEETDAVAADSGTRVWALLAKNTFTFGDNISVFVNATDGTNISATINGSALAPNQANVTIGTITFTPAAPDDTEDIVASVPMSDPETLNGYNVTVSWIIGGSTVYTDTQNNDYIGDYTINSTLSSALTTAGDVVTVVFNASTSDAVFTKQSSVAVSTSTTTSGIAQFLIDAFIYSLCVGGVLFFLFLYLRTSFLFYIIISMITSVLFGLAVFSDVLFTSFVDYYLIVGSIPMLLFGLVVAALFMDE